MGAPPSLVSSSVGSTSLFPSHLVHCSLFSLLESGPAQPPARPLFSISAYIQIILMELLVTSSYIYRTGDSTMTEPHLD